MLNWFDMPAQGLSNGGQFEIEELSATENKVYQEDGKVYSKVTVNVEGGGGSSDFSTAEVTVINSTGSNISWTPMSMPICDEGDPNTPVVISQVHLDLENNASITYTVPLYKGGCFWGAFTDGQLTYLTDGSVVAIQNFGFYITGDGSITITIK